MSQMMQHYMKGLWKTHEQTQKGNLQERGEFYTSGT